MSIDLSTLNSNQLAAVEWPDGPLLVMAGPGSGKTRVLTFHIARILEKTPAERFKILGITFTNKAADEMRSRLNLLAEGHTRRTMITTFHSFAAEILRQHGHMVGLKPDFTIITDEADRSSILKEIVQGMSQDLKEYLPEDADILPVIDKALSQFVSSEEMQQTLPKSGRTRMLAEIYLRYRTQLIETNNLDFATLVSLAVRLLESSPPICKQVQRIYKHVCVDEFQDTNALQFRLLKKIVPQERPNLFIVADDDQVIYQWNGASPQRLQEARSLYQMTTVQLPENYRCPPAVVALANDLIRNNLDRPSDKKPLVAHKNDNGLSSVQLKSFQTFDEEVTWVIQLLEMIPLSDRGGTAVLARTKRLLDNLIAKCKGTGVEAHFAARKNEFVSPQLVWMHSALRIANASKSKDLVRRLCRSFRSLEGKAIDPDEVVENAVFLDGDNLRSFLELALASEGVNDQTLEYLRKASATLLERKDFQQFIELTFTWLEMLQGVSEEAESIFNEFQIEKQTWRALQKEITSQYGEEQVTLYVLLQELDLRSKEPPSPPGSVRCFTIHSAKGLEFKKVFILGMVEDQLPSWAAVKKGSDSDEMREERRNCFVAITRAEELLTITYATEYFGYTKAPSRFLGEMGLF